MAKIMRFSMSIVTRRQSLMGKTEKKINFSSPNTERWEEMLELNSLLADNMIF